MATRLWPWAWVGWLIAVALSFGVLEEAAYRRRRHPTLSRCLRRWLGRHGPLILASSGAALAVHVARLKDN